MRARLAAWTVATLCVAPVVAAPAVATYDPVSSGRTKLTFAAPFLEALRENGVKLTALAPAKVAGGTATFPVSGGKLDPVAVKGTVEHTGAIVFRSAEGKLPLKALALKTTQARSPLSAKLGGGQLKLAATSRLSTERAGFGLAAEVSRIKLSAKVATRLDKKLGLRGVFVAGQPLGRATTNAQPASVAIAAEGKASLDLAPGFGDKLASLFVAVNPLFPAEHPGPFTLPITAGKLAPDGSGGTLQTLGGLELLQIGGGQLFLEDLWPELGVGLSAEEELRPSPPYAGKLGRVAVFGLGGGIPGSAPSERTISLSAATLNLPVATAQTLNEAFARPQGKADVFAPGEALGTISFTAQGQ